MEKVIEVKNFSKKYDSLVAVNKINFTVNKGEIVGFVGKNGAGKSTTIRCICNMLFPSDGEIKVFGLDSIQNAKEIKQKLSYMPSETQFYDHIKVKELLNFSNKWYSESIEKALSLAKYFELDLERKVSELSYGNRKKVAIILTLMQKSELIILDEPTNGLDPYMQQKVFNILLKEANEGCTIFLSSHNLSEIEKYCTRALIIKDGEIIDDLEMKDVSKKIKQVVYYILADGSKHQYELNEDINELISKLSTQDLTHLEIRNKTVEEEFIAYYQEDENEEK